MLRVMNKNITIKLAAQFFNNAKTGGLYTHAYWITGVPNETIETAKKSIKLMAKWLREELTYNCEVNILTGYPGTEFYENPQKFGVTWQHPDFSIYDGRNIPMFETVNLTRRDLEYLFHLALDTYCEVMEERFGSKENIKKQLGNRFPNFNPAWMEVGV